jgi:amino-acid N-acetyltransferase
LLTTQALDWSYHFGLVDGTADELPPTKRDHYKQKRKSRILMLTLDK